LAFSATGTLPPETQTSYSRLIQVVLAVFLTFAGLGATIPTLPVYLRQDLRLADSAAGFVLGLLWAMAFLGRFQAGPFADRRGRRLTLLVGYALFMVAGLLYLPHHVLPLALGRAICGIGEAYVLTATATWVVELGPANRRAQALGYMASGVWGGLSVGTVVSTYLHSFTQVALLCIATSAASFLMMLRLPADRGTGAPPAQRALVFQATFTPGLVLGLTNLAYAVLNGFLPIYLASKGTKGGAAFSGFAIAVLLTRLFLGSLPDRLGPYITLYSGQSLMIVSLVGLIYAPTPVWQVVAAVCAGIGYSFPWPSLATIVLGRVRAEERGSTLATLTAYFDLFVALGSAAAGMILGRFGILSVMWFAVMSVAAGMVVSASRLRPVRSEGGAGPVEGAIGDADV
jgi:MFS family permease